MDVFNDYIEGLKIITHYHKHATVAINEQL